MAQCVPGKNYELILGLTTEGGNCAVEDRRNDNDPYTEIETRGLIGGSRVNLTVFTYCGDMDGPEFQFMFRFKDGHIDSVVPKPLPEADPKSVDPRSSLRYASCAHGIHSTPSM